MLIPDRLGGFLFPSYIAHLIANAGRVAHPLIAPFACATIVNGGATTQTANLTVRFGSYLTMDATSSVPVNAGQTVTSCPSVAFNFDALRRVAVATPCVIVASARDGSGSDLGSVSQAVAAMPIDSIINGTHDLNDLIAVTVEPPQVRSVLPSVSSASAFVGGFGDSGYRRGPPLSRPSVTIPYLSWFYDGLWLESGESIGFTLGSVSGGTVNMYVFSQSQYGVWSMNTAVGAPASAVWVGQGSGARQTFVAPTTGIYYFVIHNPQNTATSRFVSWGRNNTQHDVATDALRAIYTTLQARRFTYSNIPSDYFGAVGQHVRLPAESLAGGAGANCIDGTVLFASLLELAGMEPVLIVRRQPGGGGGHAYVGVKARPSNYNPHDPVMFAAPATIWAVETTMLGSDTFAAAQSRATAVRYEDFSNYAAMRPGADYYEVDVAALRNRGITPIP